jgi:imidazolonepropionase-like amidohydrolase
MIRLFAGAALAALLATVPASAQTVAVTNAHILGAASGEIPSGTIVIQNGKITAVGAGVAVPSGAQVLDAAGKIVTPGLVAPDTDITITEVGGVPETNDSHTLNNRISAAFDIQYAVNQESPLLATARATGVTRAIVTPGQAGGFGRHSADRQLIFQGQGAVVQLGVSGDPITRTHAVMVLELGETGAGNAGGGRPATIVTLKASLAAAREFAKNRAGYDRGASRPYDLSPEDLQALLPVAEGRMPLLVHVHRATDMTMILKVAREEGLKLIFEGAEEGWMVADQIAAAHVPVIIDSEADIPASFESIGARLDNAARLQKAGVLIAIEGARNWGNVREARFNAGTAVAYGLPYAAAVASVTSNPAKMFGEDGNFGVIAPGRVGDLVVWDGDPLEVTSAPVAVLINGVSQPDNSRSAELAKRYLKPSDGYPAAYH